MPSLDGKVALITGASKGIGWGIARHFARSGAALAICSRDAVQLEGRASELRAWGTHVFQQACDVSDRDAVRAFVSSAWDALQRIDILVNNAAFMMRPEPFDNFADEVYDECIAVSLNSVFYLMKAVLPHMKERGGKIVNFSSMAGLRGTRNLAGYAAAKMGVVGLTKVAAMEWAKYHINVNCIAPIAMSDAWQQAMAQGPPGRNPFDAIGLRRNALNYVGDPEEDIGPVVAFLCSDAAKYITGHILPVDGGLLELET